MITAHIADYVRNQISTRQELRLEQLEEAFLEEMSELPRQNVKQDDQPKRAKKDKLEGTRSGIILQERINATMFQ